MSNSADSALQVLDSIAGKEHLAFAELMPHVAKEFDKPLSAQLRDMLSLCLRGNKLSVEEYYHMRLYDDVAYSMEDKKRFVGLQRSRKIWAELLKPNTHLGTIDDKLAYEKLLSGFGLPVTDTVAIVGGHYPECGGIDQIDSAEKLAAFFASVQMPIFGKPVDSLQSLGSAKFDQFDKTKNELTLTNGKTITIAQLFEEIEVKFNSNYIFQRCIQTHTLLNKICNGGLPTVRIVTLNADKGPELYRACIKLTTAGNVADNFWRSGNMLAAVDLENGTLGKALNQMGPEGEFLDKHPVTGEQIEGVSLPYFDQLKDMATAAAKLMPSAVIIGFDIALSNEGPIIVEANSDPHLIMLQVAHGKGVLDEKMLAALDYVSTSQRAKSDEVRAILAKERAEAKVEMKKATALKAT